VTAQPFTDITDALERAARNGTRAHLDPELVRALISSDAYPSLLKGRQRELTKLWQERNPVPVPEPSSAPSGSGTDRTATTGKSVGTMTEAEQVAVAHAASLRALEAVRQTSRLRRRRTA